MSQKAWNLDPLAKKMLASRVRRELDHLRDTSQGLDSVCLALEVALAHIVMMAVIRAIAEAGKSQGVTVNTGMLPIFSLENSAYSVHAQPSTDEVNVFTVVVRREGEQDPGGRGFTTVDYNVDGFGRFERISVRSSKSFQAAHIVGEAAVTAVEAAYQWLFDFVAERLDALGAEGPARLYQHLRSTLPNLADQIWLYTIVDGQGFYIVDRDGQGQILEKLASRRRPSVVSPLHLWGKFSEQTVPFDLLFSKESFKTEKGLPAFFDAAKYAPSGLGSAEMGAYGSEGIISQPLVRGERGVQLGVGYPLEIKAEVQDPLHRASSQFKSIVEASHDALTARVTELARIGGGSSEVAEELLNLVEAKPGFLGFSVDLKELYALLRKLWKSRRGSEA